MALLIHWQPCTGPLYSHKFANYSPPTSFVQPSYSTAFAPIEYRLRNCGKPTRNWPHCETSIGPTITSPRFARQDSRLILRLLLRSERLVPDEKLRGGLFAE